MTENNCATTSYNDFPYYTLPQHQWAQPHRQLLILGDFGSLRELYDKTKSSNIELTEEHEVLDNNVTIRELREILQDKDSWKEDGIFVSESSVGFAIQFVKNSIIKHSLPEPKIEIHPDGQIAFTWRKSGVGIINIAFDETGVATWAAYFENPKRSLKGRFYVQDSIPNAEKSIVTDIYRDDR